MNLNRIGEALRPIPLAKIRDQNGERMARGPAVAVTKVVNLVKRATSVVLLPVFSVVGLVEGLTVYPLKNAWRRIRQIWRSADDPVPDHPDNFDDVGMKLQPTSIAKIRDQNPELSARGAAMVGVTVENVVYRVGSALATPFVGASGFLEGITFYPVNRIAARVRQIWKKKPKYDGSNASGEEEEIAEDGEEVLEGETESNEG